MLPSLSASRDPYFLFSHNDLRYNATTQPPVTMYLRYYGFRDKPFKLAHDPLFYYAAAHQVPLNELCYSIEERQGLALLVGVPGTGKTTLLRRLLQSFGPHQKGIFLSDTALEQGSLLRKVAISLGVPGVGMQKDLGDFLWRLLLRETQSGKLVVLLIDEAQGLTPQQFEEVRYLNNLEVSRQKLLEIILAGQPDLERRLSSPEAAALKQRVAVRCRLEALDLPHTAAYIEHRLLAAGSASANLFTSDGIQAIFQHSGGIPRLINIICERSLLVGYVEEAKTLDRGKVEEALSDLRMDSLPDTEPPHPERRRGREDLIERIGAKLETMEEKLDLVVRALMDRGFIHPNSIESPYTRRWLEDLRGESSKVVGYQSRSEPPPESNPQTRLRPKKLRG